MCIRRNTYNTREEKKGIGIGIMIIMTIMISRGWREESMMIIRWRIPSEVSWSYLISSCLLWRWVLGVVVVSLFLRREHHNDLDLFIRLGTGCSSYLGEVTTDYWSPCSYTICISDCTDRIIVVLHVTLHRRLYPNTFIRSPERMLPSTRNRWWVVDAMR